MLIIVLMEVIISYFFFSVAGLQFIYLLIYSKLAFFNKKKGDFRNPVSIVVCGHNEAENWKCLLPILLDQEYPEYEIVVVNDQSNDNTKYILKEWDNHPKVKVVNIGQDVKKRIGKKFPLTLGIKASKYDYLLLTDADCIPKDKFWISAMVCNFSNEKNIILGYGGYKKQNGILNKLIRFDTFHVAMQYFSYALIGQAYMGVGRNLAYKKSLFFDNKGFSSHLQIPSGDDDLFIRDIADSKNVTITLDKSAHTLSDPETTFFDWINQKKRHLTTGVYYHFLHKLLLFLYSFSQMFFLVIGTFLLLKSWMFIEVLSIVLARLLFQLIIYYKLMIKMEEKDLILLFPLWEILHVSCQLFFVISNFFNRKKNW